MRRRSVNQQVGLEKVPKLVPAGSVNKVLLLGGKNLTLFQSIGLTFVGLCFGIVGVALAAMFRDQSYAFYLQLFGCAFALWGLVMIVNGMRSVIKRLYR